MLTTHKKNRILKSKEIILNIEGIESQLNKASLNPNTGATTKGK